MRMIAVLYLIACVSLCGMPPTVHGGATPSTTNTVANQLEQEEKICVLNLPGFASLPLPEIVRDLLETVVFDHSDAVFRDDGTVEVALNVSVCGQAMELQLVATPSLQVIAELFIPEGWRLSTMFPALAQFDMFSCKNMRLLITNVAYTDEPRNIIIKPGANLFGTLSLSGPLQHVALLLGKQSIDVNMSGHILPAIVGSSFCAQLPGSIQFFDGIVAMDPQLVIQIEETTSIFEFPVCSLEAGLMVTWPGQEPLFLSSTIEMLPGVAQLYGSLEGMFNNIFGFYGLHAGNLVVGGAIDYSSIATGDFIPLFDFMMQFELGLGEKTVKLTSCFGLSGLELGGELAFEGTIEGGFSLDECVEFAAGIIEETPTYPEGKKEFKERVDGFMPDFVLDEVNVLFSLNEMEIVGRQFTRGLLVDGRAQLFGSDVQVLIDVQKNGLKILGYLEELEFGPLTITGPGYDRIMDTPDDGLILDAELTLDNQHCFIAGQIEVDILGGISNQTIIDISPAGLSFETNKKLFDLFDCGLEFTAALSSHWLPSGFYVRGYMHQSALTRLQNMLSTTARRMAKSKMRFYRRSKLGLYGTISNIYDGFWNLLASLVGNTFNITEFTFESGLSQLVGKTAVPSVSIKGVVLGKEFELHDITFDLGNPIESVKEIVYQVSHLFD